MLEHDILREWYGLIPGLAELRAATRGDPRIHIAVLDGFAEGFDGLSPAADAHGTMVASIVGGDCRRTVCGFAPACTVRTVNIYAQGQQDSQGIPVCSQRDLAKYVHQALDAGAVIINISAAQMSDQASVDSVLGEAIAKAVAADVLMVAAVGNQGSSSDTIPASLPGVLAVGAQGPDGEPLPTSNWGPVARSQGLLAPGLSVPGACIDGSVCRASGTSFAAAAISGIAALLMSLALAAGKPLGGARVRQILLDTARPCNSSDAYLCARFLRGRLDVIAAMQALKRGSDIMPQEEKSMSLAQAENVSEANLLQPAGALVIPEVAIQPAGEANGQCACGGAGNKPQLAYAIGRLGVSFPNQTRRDAFWRAVNGNREVDLKPIDNNELLKLLKEQPFQAQSLIWTLSRTEVPMYAIVPSGAFASETYRWLVEEWADSAVEFASVPGILAGKTTLYDGSVVDVLVPDLRGLSSWSINEYTDAIFKARRAVERDTDESRLQDEIGRYLKKILFTIRNRGVAPEDRALNAAATNAFNVSSVIVEAGREGMTLRDVRVERSPFSRPGGDYFDVLLTFFDPARRLDKAPLLARFTIDVADTVPVMIGEPTVWYEY